MENYKELLTVLYKEHAPDKLDQIDFYLDRYKGKEKQFYITQKAKYAKRRSVTDSKKILEEAMQRIAARKKEGDSKIRSSKKEEPKPKKVEKPEPKPVVKKEKPEPIIKKEKKTEDVEEKVVEKVIITKTIIKEKEIKTPEVKKSVKASNVVVVKEDKPKEKIKEEPIRIDDSTPILNPSVKEKPQDIKKESKEDKQKEIEKIRDREKEELAKSKEKLAKSKKKEEKKRKPGFIWIVVVIAILVLFIALIVFFIRFYNNDTKDKEQVKTQKVTVENKKVTIDEEETSDKTANYKDEETKEPIKQKEEPKTVAKEEKKEVVKEKPAKEKTTKPTAERLYADDIEHPSIFVACFAVKSESMAQEKVAVLKKYGLDGHYYWIPDLDAQGNKYFKVVAGPFDSMHEAYPSLTKSQERVNFDAYILIIK